MRVITTSLSCYPDNYLTNCVHIIYGIKLVDRMLNFELYRLSQQRPVTTTIQVKQLRWSGNTLQHPKTNHSIYMLCTNLPRANIKEVENVCCTQSTLRRSSPRMSNFLLKKTAQDRGYWSDLTPPITQLLGIYSDMVL